MIEKRLNICALLFFTLLVTYACIKGFRMPGLWSINYYLPSFFDGFYRRSLPGTILYFLGKWRFNYYVIASIQFSVLIALLIWIYCVFRKNILIMLIISLYFISPAGGYLFHEVGHPEQLLYVILFTSIIIFKKHRILSTSLFSCSMFIHEMALFTTLPIFVTYIWMTTEDLKKVILCTLPSVIFFILIYIFFQTVPFGTILLFKEKMARLGNFQQGGGYYDIFANSFDGVRNRLYYTSAHLRSFLRLLSILILISVSVYKMSKEKIILSSLVFLTGFSPLLLGLYGCDVYRWFFLSISSVITMTVIIVLHFKINIKYLMSHKLLSLLCLLCMILLIIKTKLMYFDLYSPRYINYDVFKELKKELLTKPNIHFIPDV